MKQLSGVKIRLSAKAIFGGIDVANVGAVLIPPMSSGSHTSLTGMPLGRMVFSEVGAARHRRANDMTGQQVKGQSGQKS